MHPFWRMHPPKNINTPAIYKIATSPVITNSNAFGPLFNIQFLIDLVILDRSIVVEYRMWWFFSITLRINLLKIYIEATHSKNIWFCLYELFLNQFASSWQRMEITFSIIFFFKICRSMGKFPLMSLSEWFCI